MKQAEVISFRVLQGILRSLDFIVNIWEVTGAFTEGSAILKQSQRLLMEGQKIIKTHKKKTEEEGWLIS